MREKYEGIFRDAINRLGSVMDKRRDQPVLKVAEQQDERKRQLDELKHLLVDQVHDLVKNTVISSEEDIDQLCLAIDGLKTTIAQKYKAANIEAGFQFAKKDWEEFLAEAQEIREETRRGLIDFLHGKGELIGEDANTPVKQNNGGDKVVETSYEDEFLDIVTSPNPPEWLRPFQKEIESMIGKVDNSVLVKLAGTIRSEYEKRNQLIGGAIENAEKEKNEAEELAREMQSRLVTQADQVGRLEKLNAEKVRENDNLARKNADQKAELKLKEEALAVYRSMAKELDRTKADLERVKLGFKDEIRFHDAEETRLKEKIVEVSGNLAAAKREIASLKEKLSKNTVTEEERAVQAEQAEENGRLKGDLEKQNQTIELARREVDAVTERHRLAEEKIQELERLIDELWKAGEKLGGESIAFKAQLEKTASELEMLSGAINILEQETKNKDNKYAEDIDELRRHLDNSGRLLEKTQALLDTSNGIIDSLRNDNEEVLRLTGELHDSEQLVDAQLQRINELLVKLGDEQKKNQELIDAMEAVTTIRAKETDELKRTITEKDDSIKELEGLVEAADEEAAKTEIKLADQTRIIESLSAKLHEKDGSSETKEPIKGKNYEITEFLRYRQDLLKQRIFTIDDELRRLSEQDEEIAVWLDQAYDQKERVVGSELADAEAQEKFNMPGAAREAQRLRIAKQKLEIIISDIQNGEAYKQLRDRIAAVETERRDLIRQKDAVQLLEADIQVEAKSKPPSSKFDISLPDLGALVYRLTTIDGVEEEIIDDYKSKKVGTEETSSEERIQIEGLNFPVSFTETELVRVHDIEEEIKKFFGKSEEEVRTQLVFIPEDDYRKNHYDKLVESLTSDPEYLQKIHMAIVILGTMRDEEGKFVARVANKINYTLKAREVRLAKDFTEAARMTSNIYQQLDILGSINEAWRLLGKKNVGSKWGKANELTIFGQIASQIWTKELLDKRFLTREQLNALYDRSQIISKRTETEEKDSDGESESDSALTISKPRIRISNTSDGKKSGGLKKK